jgi:hypothetical protein
MNEKAVAGIIGDYMLGVGLIIIGISAVLLIAALAEYGQKKPVQPREKMECPDTGWRY